MKLKEFVELFNKGVRYEVRNTKGELYGTNYRLPLWETAMESEVVKVRIENKLEFDFYNKAIIINELKITIKEVK